MTRPIYSASWTADEEERLLEGLEMYGVGNWEDISRVIQTRNKGETENHFEAVFLNHDLAPIPDMRRDTLLPKDDPEWLVSMLLAPAGTASAEKYASNL